MTAALGVALPVVPFAAALLGFLLPRSSRLGAGFLGILGAAAGLAIAIVLAVRVDGLVEVSYASASFGQYSVSLDVRLNEAATFVAIAVGVVALAVQVYSTSYLRSDDRYAPYAAQVSLFTAAMLVVVVSGDLVMLLIGWEVMGICSYLLIGHDRRLPEAPAAAVKAFLVTRVGDIGFFLAVAVMGVRAGSFRIADVLAPGALDAATITVVCLLLLAGVAGKSAQFPLHTWLPDAMAGPTPISALIHAATMVAAGIYVVTRLYPLFLASPTALDTLAIVAALTMLLGALAAAVSEDIKRVLAWSTVSQIAYMTGALAVGAPAAALFHLLAHAAFKALLFLAAGSVIHAVGTNLMSGMGGLRRTMPVTFLCTTIGLGALVGVPPLAGFWSKEEILHVAVGGTGWRHLLVYGVGLATVFVTACYATRLWLRTFFGAPRSASLRAEPGDSAASLRAEPGDSAASLRAEPGDSAASLRAEPGDSAASLRAEPGDSAASLRAEPGDSAASLRAEPGDSAEAAADGHEPPRPMAWPVVGLAVPSAALGFLALSPGFARSLGASEAFTVGADAAVPVAWAGLGIGAVYWMWRQRPAEDPARLLGPLRPVFANAFYVDAVQDTLVVRPVKWLARIVRRLDESGVDGAVEATGRGTLGLGGLLGAAHRAGLPRAVTAVLGGAALLGIAAVAIVEVWP